MKYLSYILIIITFLFGSFAYPQLINDFKINDDTAGNVFRHSANISTNKNGLSAIVWEEYVLGNIYAQIYDKNFVKINNNFKVNTGIDSSRYPDIIVTDKDKIGIVWQKQNGVANYKCGTYFRLFDKYGFPLTLAVRLNDTLQSYLGRPKIGCDSSGRFIATWSYAYRDVYYQILDSAGNKIGNNVKVNEIDLSLGQQNILVRKGGSFIIVWRDNREPGINIYMQMFNKNGTHIGVNQKVNDTIGPVDNCSNPRIVQDSSGNFIIAFNVYILNSNMTYVRYQRYNKDGIKIGNNKTVVSSFTTPLSSFDCDEIGNLIFQLNLDYAMNLRIDRFDNPIGGLFLISNEYIESGKGGEDVKLFNKRIINVWRDIRLTPQPQIYANVRSFINPDSTVGIFQISNEIPKDYKLFQNFPNPFNNISKIKYQISKSEVGIQKSEVRIVIFDILGKEITTLVKEQQSPGTYEISFEGNNYSTGIYFYSLYINNELLETKKMLLLK